MWRPENNKEYREMFYDLHDMVRFMIRKQISKYKEEKDWRDNTAIIFNFNSASMIAYAPGNYLQITSAWKIYGHETMDLFMLSYHDSGWDAGVDKFIEHIVEHILGYNRLKKVKSLKLMNCYSYRMYKMVDLEKEGIVDLFSDMDYGKDYHKEKLGIPIEKKLFPLS